MTDYFGRHFDGDEMFDDPDALEVGEYGDQDNDARDRKAVANPKL